MKAALLLLLATPTQDDRVFLETEIAKESYFVHEPIRLHLRVGIERKFLEENLVPLFPQKLDLPVQVEASWIDSLPGASRVLGSREDQEERWTLALNDGKEPARKLPDRRVGERSFLILEIERSYLPESAGKLLVPESRLRLAYASRFEEDFVHGRVAQDRQEMTVAGKGATLSILPLPETGRPSEFAGAVGRFSIAAEATPRELAKGESLKLRLTIEGEGNRDSFPAPRLDSMRGFHLYGQLENRQNGRREIIYDLAPLGDGVRELPSIAFAFFDPGPPAQYRTIRTQPIAIRVAGDGSLFSWWPGALALAAVSFLFWHRARRRRTHAADAKLSRLRQAASLLDRRLQHAGHDPADAFAEFLAALLSCPPAAVIASDLSRRLQEAGISESLANRCAKALEDGIAARYGGTSKDSLEGEVRLLAKNLMESFPIKKAGTISS